MSRPPRLIAFDLDETLAPSKAPIDPRIGAQLIALAERIEVAVISGGQLAQFQSQVVDRLPAAPQAVLSHLHLLPTCGTQYYRVRPGGLETVYNHPMTADEKHRATAALQDRARHLGLWEAQPWGQIIEDRGSQITFSALGQDAPLEAKAAWDPTGARKNALRAAVAELLPDLEVRSGGSTSVDVTHRGIDKAYGMTRLSEQTGIALGDMLFLGDRLDPDGNDYPVLAMGVPCRTVTGWQDTAGILDELIPTLPPR